MDKQKQTMLHIIILYCGMFQWKIDLILHTLYLFFRNMIENNVGDPVLKQIL